MARVVTENDLPEKRCLDTIKFLTYYRPKPDNIEEILARSTTIMKVEEQLTISSYLNYFAGQKDAALTCLYHLICLRAIDINWGQDLGLGTILSRIERQEDAYDPLRFW